VNCLVFDIETVPDVELGRRIHGLNGLPDAEVAKAMFALRRQETSSDFLPHEQHRIVAISCVRRYEDKFNVWSLGDLASPEEELVRRFFDGIDRYEPDLISWNGSGFDLPVLHYRALQAGVQAKCYWKTGDDDQAFRYRSYLSRFHWRHMDLMDILSAYQKRASASLEDITGLLGLPGKLGFSGAQVWDAWLAGNLAGIRHYCETDVLNTWLIYLRFELMRAKLTRERYAEEVERVRVFLRNAREPHLAEFLRAWEARA